MMRLVFALLCSLGLAGTALAATPDPDILKPVQAFMDSFNKGDVKAAAATHAASGVVILDEVAPYQWQGPGAFDKWLADLMAHDQQNGVTDGAMALGKVQRVESTATDAYVVQDAVYSFKQKGTPMRATAQFTVVLHKGDTGWLITGWAYTSGPPRSEM